MIDGVCSGIADYLGIESSVVRLALIAFTIFSFGAGIVFYIAAMIVVPLKPRDVSGQVEGMYKASRDKRSDIGIVTGVVVLIIGIIVLFHHYNILVPWFGLLDLRLIGRLALPIILILIGSLLLMGREKESMEDIGAEQSSQAEESINQQAESSERKKLLRSIHDVKVAGVCGGLADYLNMDSTLVRLAIVLLALASFGMALILYFVCALFIPKEEI